MSTIYEYLVQSRQDDINRRVRQTGSRRPGRAIARDAGRAKASAGHGIRLELRNTHSRA
ncbi:MAG TPA: hypothetical protein VNQ77_10575 [Frankiaceae bacterium]|nr:hypothetical protein [Frankiaceae bacterium]